MKFIFWQNIISIHQSAFLNALSEKHELVLIVEKNLEKGRKEQGWSIPGLEKIRIITAPSENQMVELLNDESIHVFSGIYSYPMVSNAFRQAVKKGLKIGVLLEPFKWIGVKGKFRWVKYYLLKFRFGSKIDFIAATGELGALQYGNIGFEKQKIFEWGYFVELSKLSINNEIKKTDFQKPSILFVGSIDDRKNIIPQIEIIKKFEDHIRIMTIVGDGPLKEELLTKIQGYSIFDYKGNLRNNEVKKLMSSHDILILPSKFDGWGAVVNEALHAGMRVIASENCGASVLLDGEVRGEKFQFKGDDDFEKVLLKWIKKGSVSADERVIISEWANKNISGKAAAEYFERIIKYVYDDKSERPIAPWKY